MPDIDLICRGGLDASGELYYFFFLIHGQPKSGKKVTVAKGEIYHAGRQQKIQPYSS